MNAFNEAFGRHDVDAVMNLMTDDCVFENTLPPPDGDRYVGQADVRKFWQEFFDGLRRRASRRRRSSWPATARS